jgi:quercetin 2,3-dioxygenase
MARPRPTKSGGLFYGLQLWVNLPAKLKWTEPRYQICER